MADYKVTFKTSVDKDLTALLNNLVARVWQRLELLKHQPFPRQVLKLEGLYRIRVEDYRVISGVDGGAKQVIIHHVRHRREVYRSL